MKNHIISSISWKPAFHDNWGIKMKKSSGGQENSESRPPPTIKPLKHNSFKTHILAQFVMVYLWGLGLRMKPIPMEGKP